MKEKDPIKEAIKSNIKKKGFTAEMLAAQMTDKSGNKGITQSAASQIINGNPTLDKLKEIATIIGVSVSELVAEEHESAGRGFTCPKCGTRLRLVEDED